MSPVEKNASLTPGSSRFRKQEDPGNKVEDHSGRSWLDGIPQKEVIEED